MAEQPYPHSRTGQRMIPAAGHVDIKGPIGGGGIMK